MADDISQLCHYLQSQVQAVYVEEDTAHYAKLTGFPTRSLSELHQVADLVIVMGGDGTLLSVARHIAPYNIPLIGINRGRLGFLTDLRTEDMWALLTPMLAGEVQTETRLLLSVVYQRAGVRHEQGNAFNDVVIRSGARLIELEVRIDQQLMHRQRSDGLIIASPTGTTAYALSAGGPILHPSLDAISLVPICPHSLSNRPIVIPSHCEISVAIMQADEVRLTMDGQVQLALQEGDIVLVRRAPHHITLLHPPSYCYYEMLRNKLSWG